MQKPHLQKLPPVGRWACFIGPPMRPGESLAARRVLCVGWSGWGDTPADAYRQWKQRNSTPPSAA